MNEIFIKEIQVKELINLKDINIEVGNDKSNLLITGKNGCGKTTLLNSIKKYLSSIQQEQIQEFKHIKKEIDMFKHLLQTREETKPRLTYESKIKQYNAKLLKYDADKIIINFNMYEQHIVDIYRSNDFILAYYEAKRVTNIIIPDKIEKVNLKGKYLISERPSDLFLKYLVDLKTQESFARNEEDYDFADKIKNWFKKFENLLKDLLEDNSTILKFNYRNYDFKIIQDKKEPYGFNELSDGYSSILSIVSDLMLRMSNCNDFIFNTQGIVLIDEIETHLHIDLQKKIFPFLTNLFPKIQFIATTHSPFVLSSASNTVVYDLEKKIKMEGMENYSYEGIVEGYFEIDNYSTELKEKINEYRELAFRDNLNEEERARRAELRIDIKNHSNDLAKELKSEFDEIERLRNNG